MSDQSFDKIIKDALQDFGKASKPGDWSLFSERVAREVDSDPEDVFDSLIREKLTHYEAPYQPAHWDQFSHELDASLHDHYAEELDQHIQSSLRNFEVPYAPETWSRLEEKLIAHRYYIRRLYLTKSLEVAALVLFLFTFYRYWPVYQDFFQTRDFEIPVASSPVNTGTEKQELRNDASIAPESVVADAVHESVGTGLENTVRMPVNSTPTAGIRQSSTQRTSIDGPLQVTTNNFSSVAEAESHDLNRQRKLLDRTLELPSEDQAMPVIQPALESEVADAVHRDPLASFAALREPSAFNFAQSSENAIHLSAYENERKQRVPKRISMFGTMDINHALLSAFKLNDKVNFNEKEVTNLGHGAGVSIVFDYGKVELETGVQYNNIQNDPNTQVKVGTPTIGIEDFDYYLIDWDVIKLPLNVNYKLKDEGRVQYYASFGVDLNIVANATYYYSAPPITAFRVPDPNDAAGRNSRNSINRDIQQMQTSLLDKQKKDAYFNIHVGAGMEYLLTDRHRLFVETAFQQPMLTPSVINEKDRFKTISSKLGARMDF